MNQLAPVGIAITTYEGNNPRPILTHISWGDDLQSAYGVLNSHLITDYFFSGSFHGGITWKGQFLRLTNDGQIIGQWGYNTQQEAQEILQSLARRAEQVDAAKQQLGIIQQIEFLSRQ